jgi:hypothetical protein
MCRYAMAVEGGKSTQSSRGMKAKREYIAFCGALCDIASKKHHIALHNIQIF